MKKLFLGFTGFILIITAPCSTNALAQRRRAVVVHPFIISGARQAGCASRPSDTSRAAGNGSADCAPAGIRPSSAGLSSCVGLAPGRGAFAAARTSRVD
jgi:hypothetical protein